VKSAAQGHQPQRKWPVTVTETPNPPSAATERLDPVDALRVAFSWIGPLPECRPDSTATCAYVPREVYERLKEALSNE
jgi:hypothetical protein